MTAQINDFTHRYAESESGVTFLLLHGTGGDEEAMLPVANAIAPDAGVLSPRGKVLEGNAPRFFRRLAEGVFDMEDLTLRTHELADWVDVAAVEYGIDSDSLVAVGYSNGANIAASVMLLRPGVIKRAVLLRPMVPLVPETAPDLHGVSVLITAGVHDPLIPLQEAKRLADLLTSYGADVEFVAQPIDHRLTNADIQAAQDWLQRTANEQ